MSGALAFVRCMMGESWGEPDPLWNLSDCIGLAESVAIHSPEATREERDRAMEFGRACLSLLQRTQERGAVPGT